MTTRNRLLVVPAVLAVSGALALGGCSSSPPPDLAPGATSRGLDTEQYVRDYEEQTGQDSAAGAMPSTAEADGAGSTVLPEVPEVPEPGVTEDNRFVDAGTSGFVDAATDAESTFALDVDTGSLGVARALLEAGELPPPASIRVEEWVNAMPHGDVPPTEDGAALGVVSETVLAPGLDDGTQLVRVAVGAREVTPAERPRVNVTLVVDRSGSMDVRERLGLVQSSLALLADRLDDDDTVSVVSFEDEAVPVLEPTPVRDTDAVLEAVENLTPGGSTNLEAGLRLGYEQAREGFEEDAVNLVVLCSDGVANVGRTGPGSIAEQIAEEGADGIHLVTVGFGMGSYDDHLMEQLADLGDGFYSYVDDYEEAERLFGTDLTTTLTPVAAEARAQVAFDPALVSSYRLVGYENRAIADEDFEDLDVDAGELGAGHRATALYEVRLADEVEPGAVIGDAAVRWREVDGGRPGAASAPVRAADGAEASSDLLLAAATADLAQLLKGAEPVADRGLTLEGIAERAAALDAADVTGAADLRELVELAQDARG